MITDNYSVTNVFKRMYGQLENSRHAQEYCTTAGNYKIKKLSIPVLAFMYSLYGDIILQQRSSLPAAGQKGMTNFMYKNLRKTAMVCRSIDFNGLKGNNNKMD